MAGGLASLAAGAAALLLAPPAGFSRSEQLSTRASRVSGVPATVSCARDHRSWTAFMTRNGLGPIAAQIEGLTKIEQHETFLHPRVCLRLGRWLAGRPVPLAALADAIFTFTHEAAHLRGTVNECAADRWAVGRLARVARTEFGIRDPARLRELVRLARDGAGYVPAC